MSSAAAGLQKGVGRWSGLLHFLSEQTNPYHACTKIRHIDPYKYRISNKPSLRSASSKAQKPQKSRSLPSTPAKHTTLPKPGKFVSIPRSPAYRPFAQSLAIRQSPTLLYQVHSQTNFTVGCYIVGGILVVVSVVNFYNEYLHPLERTWAYVPTMMAGVSLVALCLALLLIRRVRRFRPAPLLKDTSSRVMKPRNVVQSISALPSTRDTESTGLMLQIEKVKIFPGTKNPPLIVRSADITLSTQLYQNNQTLGRDYEAEIRRRLIEMHRANQTKILSRPFREAGYWIWRAFRGFTRIFAHDPVIRVNIKGESGSLKMYKTGGWALDDGSALDRTVMHKV